MDKKFRTKKKQSFMYCSTNYKFNAWVVGGTNMGSSVGVGSSVGRVVV